MKDGKKMRENKERNFFLRVLSWEGERKKRRWGPNVFSLDLLISFLSKMRKKLGEGKLNVS